VQHLKLNIAEPAVRKVLLMRIYKQLNHSERVKISVLKQSGASITLIGEQLGRSKSTIVIPKINNLLYNEIKKSLYYVL